MSAPTRWIIVDDTDPGVQYNGAWSQVRDALDDLGNLGPLFEGTSHAVNANASLTYSFSGSRVIAYGTSKVQKNSSSGIVDPTWACFVDGVSIGSKDYIFFPENNWMLCEADSLSNGQHIISVQTTVLSPTNSFAFDRFQYFPSPSVPLDNATIFVDSSDSAVQYGSGWGPLGEIAEMTQQNGAKITFDFVGVQLSWVSMIPSNLSIAPASATYSIDGSTPVSFPLTGLKAGETEAYNQIFFQTPQLSPGKHHLEVVHGGNAQTTPLSLDYFVITNATLPSGKINPNLSTTKSKVPVGMVVGGAIAGVFVVFAIVLLYLRFRPKKKGIEKYAPADISISATTIEPFNAIPYAPSASQPLSSGGPSVSFYPIQTTGKVHREALGRADLPVAAVRRTSLQRSSSNPHVLLHEDSGLRLPDGEETTVVEIPPLYTAG
ncbi:hypothetical protein GALMADRAFT_105961 [Galerina marginata CBS 339.88]|uniref:Transmembrane protein n=1 Tax=Galerina marginata (strain CBS 339.88) TaxID=685588 RepID=A0A067S8G0_GALM3|nr:hypothetical protein GALMADRAFT_105961 [Galerina marginata CBS 339.88]